jgi:hypothetical protein
VPSPGEFFHSSRGKGRGLMTFQLLGENGVAVTLKNNRWRN